MPTAYASLGDVSNILMDKIKFSDSIYSIVKTHKGSNASTIMLSPVGITIDRSYYGYKKLFEIVFENNADLTEYNVYRELSTEGSRSMTFIGTGHTNAVFTVPGYLTIDPAAWSGSASYNDIIHLVTDSHMSIDTAESFINDVEAEIDQILREESIIHTTEGTIPDDLYFNVNPPVPRQIRIATAHISAFRIMNYVFDAVRSISPINYAKEDGFTLNEQDFAIAHKWNRIGLNALRSWVHIYKIQNAGNAPRYSTIGSLQGKVGVDGELYSEQFKVELDKNPFNDNNIRDTQSLLDYYTNG